MGLHLCGMQTDDAASIRKRRLAMNLLQTQLARLLPQKIACGKAGNGS